MWCCCQVWTQKWQTDFCVHIRQQHLILDICSYLVYISTYWCKNFLFKNNAFITLNLTSKAVYSVSVCIRYLFFRFGEKGELYALTLIEICLFLPFFWCLVQSFLAVFLVCLLDRSVLADIIIYYTDISEYNFQALNPSEPNLNL